MSNEKLNKQETVLEEEQLDKVIGQRNPSPHPHLSPEVIDAPEQKAQADDDVGYRTTKPRRPSTNITITNRVTTTAPVAPMPGTLRAKHFTASEASAMLGVSKYQTRRPAEAQGDRPGRRDRRRHATPVRCRRTCSRGRAPGSREFSSRR